MNDRHAHRTERDIRDVKLRVGRWYSLTLEDGRVAVMRAYSLDPGHEQWMLIEDFASAEVRDDLVWLNVGQDGSFGYAGDIAYDAMDAELDETDRVIRILDEGLTVHDLVPADAVARAAWIAQVGPYTTCPRCGASDPSLQHPLCHTADGVPLYPLHDQLDWDDEVGIFDDSSCGAWRVGPRNGTRRSKSSAVQPARPGHAGSRPMVGAASEEVDRACSVAPPNRPCVQRSPSPKKDVALPESRP